MRGPELDSVLHANSHNLFLGRSMSFYKINWASGSEPTQSYSCDYFFIYLSCFFFSDISIFPNLPSMPCMAPCAMDSSAMEGAVRSHRDFRVRRSVVHRALNWLVTHNQYYRSNHVHIDVNALEQLPHDGNLSQLTAITVENAITERPATNTPATGPPVADTPATSEDPYSAHLPQSFVPIATPSITEQEAVHQSVQEQQLSPSTSSSPAIMMWPLLEEYPSMSSQPRATSPVHFPHSSLPVREISQSNTRIRLPLATTSSI